LGVGSIFIDSFMRKGKMLYYVFFTVFFIDVVRGLSYSYLLAPDGFAIIVTKIFIFYLLYKLTWIIHGVAVKVAESHIVTVF